MEKEIRQRLDDQEKNWDRCFKNNPHMFGLEPSYSAKKAAQTFKDKGVKNILELGPGQGRDTIYFLEQGFEVTALDYSPQGLGEIKARAKDMGLEDRLTTRLDDLRKGIDLADASFDACYSHMVYCMAMTREELKDLTAEVKRILKKEGIQAYTSRNTRDSDYGKGDHLGDNIYVDGGFIIHYLDDDMVKDFSEGFEVLYIDEFEEGGLPRVLSLVVQEKN